MSILSVIVYYVGYRRLKHKRTMAALHAVEVRESRLSRFVPTRINTGDVGAKPTMGTKFMRLLRIQR